jgi:beta-glucosidase
MTPRKKLFLAALVLAGSATLAAAQDPGPAYKNTELSFDERAHDLVRHMTLEEKVSQLGHTSDAVERLGIPEYN